MGHLYLSGRDVYVGCFGRRADESRFLPGYRASLTGFTSSSPSGPAGQCSLPSGVPPLTGDVVPEPGTFVAVELIKLLVDDLHEPVEGVVDAARVRADHSDAMQGPQGRDDRNEKQ